MRTRRQPPNAIRALPLSGLESTPDALSAERMATFDRLPPSIQRFLDECPFMFSPKQAEDVVRRRGEAGTLQVMRQSVRGETQRWVAERDAALEWARDKFRIGNRPLYERPAGGWTVHNFPG